MYNAETLTEFLKLNPKSSGVLYKQLERRIKQAIEQKLLTDGDFLPPQRKLSQDLGLSRITVSRAIENLAAEGIVQQKARSGAQIVTPDNNLKVPQPLELAYQYHFHQRYAGS